MTPEDDRIRQALSRGEPSFTAHSALQQLRPTMQRARHRRRVAVGATTLALLAAVSAGALTLATSLDPPTLRTVNNDETGQSVLPEPTPVPDNRATDNRATDDASPGRHARSPSDGHCSRTDPSSVEPEADDAAPPAANGRAPGATPPVPTIAPAPTTCSDSASDGGTSRDRCSGRLPDDRRATAVTSSCRSRTARCEL